MLAMMQVKPFSNMRLLSQARVTNIYIYKHIAEKRNHHNISGNRGCRSVLSQSKLQALISAFKD